MEDRIIDETCFSYAVGPETLTFRTPRMFVLKGAARRNAELLCLIIDTITGRVPNGNCAIDDQIVAAATEFMLESGFGAEVLRDSLRGAEVPDLSEPARTQIFGNIVLLTWQMYGTLTLKTEIANIYHEHRSKVGRAPVRMPAAIARSVTH